MAAGVVVAGRLAARESGCSTRRSRASASWFFMPAWRTVRQRAALAASSITRAIRSAGRQGGEILRADERVGPGDGRVVGVRLMPVRARLRRRRRSPRISQSTAFFTPGQICFQEAAVRAELVFAVGRLDAGAVPVDERAVRGVLAVRGLAVGVQEGDEVRDPHVPPDVGKEPGVALGVVPDVRAIQAGSSRSSPRSRRSSRPPTRSRSGREGSRSARSSRRGTPRAGSTGRASAW